ncbi:methyl-accepting chemotaxis sensory transducer [Beggiatoa sp. PS]|nr:methyl-accepting chemotaxis sensory transducer [Beggiatoa sp. PS]
MKFSLSMTNTRWLFAFVSLLSVLVILMMATFFFVARQNQLDKDYLETVTQLRLLSQQITQNATRAAIGDTTGFEELKHSQVEFQNFLTQLQNGNSEETNSSNIPSEVMDALAALTNLWSNDPTNIALSIQNLLTTEKSVISLHNEKTKLQTITVPLWEKAQALINQMKGKASVEQMEQAAYQLRWLERIKYNIKILYVIKDSKEVKNVVGELSEAKRQLTEILTFLMSKVSLPNEKIILNELEELSKERLEIIDVFLEKSEALYQAKKALQLIIELNPKLLDSIEQLQTNYINASKQRIISPTLGYVLAVFVLILFVILVILILRTNKNYAQETEQRFQETQDEQQRNQEAILRLLTEISDLADGDLTINATVDEGFTGAIADAINFAVEALLDLVTRINNTAMQVTEESQKTRGTAVQLIQASERQAQQIAKAGQAIIGMANAVKKVSANAIESAEVAGQSVNIASKGANVVRNTITGMDNIREQIQETSKRIKRLGESAQEIGDIVGLIDDIADQTNILALNAAIQAAMAGEAGRGFAVVADEIQRLAERTSNAVRQIGALVNTIQGDTKEAVNSMDQSTTGVVKVSSIAERAGDSLTEIEKVSVQLAGQIEKISQTSRTQAAVAANIANTMTVIQDITTQTSTGVNETAASIEKLAERANELKESVAGFKIPSDIQPDEEMEHSV